MKQCTSIAEAQAVPSVIAIQAGTPVIAYQQGDTLPSYMVVTPSAIPQQVTMRQARLALFAAGKLASVQTVISGMADPQKTQTQIWWDNSSQVERGQPLVAQLGAAIGLAPADIDQLFVTASTL